jgi:putative solute:sodium symporter small subunit
MKGEQRKREYWRKNLHATLGLLLLWFLVTFVASYFARELNAVIIFGFPLGFYMGAQGALLVYMLIVVFYAWYMKRLDRQYGMDNE